jgi:hypothetical protein
VKEAHLDESASNRKLHRSQYRVPRWQAAKETARNGSGVPCPSQLPTRLGERDGLLIIDDFGLKPLRSPHDEDLHELIAERYERTSTLITSNLDFPEWGDAFPNRLLGAATLDRLRHGAYRVILDGESYREPRPLPDIPKSVVAKRGKTDQ